MPLEGDFLLAGIVVIGPVHAHAQHGDGTSAVLVKRELRTCLVQADFLEGVLEFLLQLALGNGFAQS